MREKLESIFNKHKEIIIIILITVAIGILLYKTYYSKLTVPKNVVIDIIPSQTEETKKYVEPQQLRSLIMVHIAGEVRRPGVYKIVDATRLVDLIKEAGGMTEKSDLTDINLAMQLHDGQKIIIPSAGMISSETQGVSSGTKSSSAVININQATCEQLQDIPGIGKKYAENIIKYREANGYFKSYDDLRKVKGIGKKRIEKIKELSVLN
ncbi:MAG: hypothetical protein DKM50_12880 [Candidatus Margulisiibacteriota bacterium]|nr:MAG: hypothetical protein A2X43_11330 [Candidatus Margulisbacteria bacterium GWD2_39_127]OGI04170.1 MAG: hypothetical protein A2X42_04615 [Candidatus Margulisbacteria bacterium GWF2_38_17]OGI09296.1 MAG: hypothetical protein A2X41_09220 [Candidatus Margulisbacteria bacterium GWE2_39_32]PZM77367.1 MAG: hypothetical protein DKM50_12880 [Candidatus Margulisiibacteriota bacterium]HAR63945.1 hypothetical protein [Candidatus Margulisiibacteriota bacterium]